MLAFHLSRSEVYRKPFGAVPALTPIRFALRVDPEADQVQSVHLCYAYGLYEFHESRQHMVPVDRKDDRHWYEAVCPMPADGCLFFYWFEIVVNHVRTFLTANHDPNDGTGRFSPVRPRYLAGEQHNPAAFQVTVHEAGFSVPAWLPGAVLYQIFPDRYHRQAGFRTAALQEACSLPERLAHLEWQEDVDFQGKPETGYLACDFFGGSLKGIEEKLDELTALGVSVLYLNPVFKARSNHRYDTGDYEQVDPLLGSNPDLENLCREAANKGIHIILDGVFSHTGADSRYFNRYERYEEVGAFQEATGRGSSAYESWYTFHRKDEELFYDSWWGFPDLPSVNEHDLCYRQYMAGPDGILQRWLKAGVSGWRLDVSDELPDSFLCRLRQAVLEEKPDAVLIGEVWEDGSNKISYGGYRDFLFGRTHDTLMGYPFQSAVIGWLSRQKPGSQMFNQLETIRENYPLVSFYSSMNLISSHDIPRAITVLAGLPDPGNREAQSHLHLSPAARQRGEALMKLAFLFQIAYPGVAAIYYGDEVGMEGYRDPFNRRTFPWGRERKALQAWYRRLGRLRQQLPVLKTGFYQPLLVQDDVFVFERSLRAGQDVFGKVQTGPGRVLVCINRRQEPCEIDLAGVRIRLPVFGGFLETDGIRLDTALDGKTPDDNEVAP